MEIKVILSFFILSVVSCIFTCIPKFKRLTCPGQMATGPGKMGGTPGMENSGVCVGGDWKRTDEEGTYNICVNPS